MFDSIRRKQEKAKTKLKRGISLGRSYLEANKLRKENEDLKRRIKYLEELLQYYQACSGEKQGATQGSQAFQVSNHYQEIPSTQTHQVVTNIIVTKGALSSPFQNKLGRRDVPVVRRQRPRSYPYCISDHNVVGIEEDVHRLVQQLINQESCDFLAIVGMGGSGKTTLARKIYNHQEISQCFACRAWVCVSQVWSEESILRDIFIQTTREKSDNLSVTEIVQEMHKLLGDKSFLVVLDDVWEGDVLRNIIVPTAKSHRSKFVVTTRNRKVIQFSDLVFSIHEPRRLTYDQSLELLKKIAFDHQGHTAMTHTLDPFVDLAREMLRKCDGLPLAVISLAGLLRTKEFIQEWIVVKENVSSKIIEDHVGPSDYGRVEDILGLSYSDLNYTLKSCFMYLSLFPEDAMIRCGVLMRCWIAEGFFKTTWLAPNETIEDVAKKCLDELIQRCLVQVVEVNYIGIALTIRVHDLLRDLALKKARRKYFSDTFPFSSSTTSAMQFLRLGIKSRDKDKPLEDLDTVSRRIRSFVLYIPPMTSSTFGTLVKTYPLLRVLILDCFQTQLPKNIGDLIHLRYLQLSFSDCMLPLPDSIQYLKNLLSFDFRIKREFSFPWKFPNLKQMKQLRYLRLPCIKKDLNNRYSLGDEYSEKPQNVHYLRNLRVLWGIEPGKWMITELKYLSPTVEKLGIAGITNSEQLDQVYQCPSLVEDNLYALMLMLCTENAKFDLQKLQHCTKLKKLSLDGEIAHAKLKKLSLDGEIAPDIPFVFPCYLLKLELANSIIEDHSLFAYALLRLTYLRDLKLTEDAYVGAKLVFPANSLLNLEKLHLTKLFKLKSIHAGEGAMPHLKCFEIDRWYKLLQIPQNLIQVVKFVRYW